MGLRNGSIGRAGGQIAFRDRPVIGMEPIEPVMLAAMVTGEPSLLIGPHGTAELYLLNRIGNALGLQWWHYNASLLNFDDLVSYPPPPPRTAKK